MSDEKEYNLVENDLFLPGSRIKLDHTIFLNECDISGLLDKGVEEVRELYNASVRQEQSMYEVLQSGMEVWERYAEQTRKLQLALNYLEIAPVEHSEFQPDEQKSSVLDKINKAKTQQKAEPAAPSKKKTEPEIS